MSASLANRRPTTSVVVPHAVRGDATALQAFAQEVEAVGLDGVFVGDHLTATVDDSTVVLAVAAAATTRIRLGFGVMVLALRHPAWAAKQLAALQRLSGGRVVLGVGVGGAAHGTSAWQAVGVPHAERGARTDAALDVLPHLVAGRPTPVDGVELTLGPGAEAPPVWVGGGSDAARRRAVARGDAWFPSMLTPAGLRAGRQRLAELAEAHGRPDVPQLAAGAAVLLGGPVDRAALDAHVAGLVDYGIPLDVAADLPLVGRPGAVAERLAAYADAGADHLVLGLVGEDWQRQLELLAAAVAWR